MKVDRVDLKLFQCSEFGEMRGTSKEHWRRTAYKVEINHCIVEVKQRMCFKEVVIINFVQHQWFLKKEEWWEFSIMFSNVKRLFETLTKAVSMKWKGQKPD